MIAELTGVQIAALLTVFSALLVFYWYGNYTEALLLLMTIALLMVEHQVVQIRKMLSVPHTARCVCYSSTTREPKEDPWQEP